MGKLTYESNLKVDFEDRALAHLQTVITSKLRRGEAFAFTWKDDPSIGDGRTSVWMHPAANLVYKFYGGRTPALDRAWLEALAYTANTPEGLHLVPEPPALREAAPASERSQRSDPLHRRSPQPVGATR